MTAVLQYGIPPLCCEDAMSELKTIEGTIAADWYVLAGAAQALLHRDRNDGAPRYTSGAASAQGGYQFNLSDPQRSGQHVGVLWFSTDPGATTVRFKVAPEVYNWCVGLQRFLDLMAGGAETIRQSVQPTADAVIRRYYMTKTRGGRITLRQLAEETGYSYAYLQKAKQRYDRAGKWGSGSRKGPQEIPE